MTVHVRDEWYDDLVRPLASVFRRDVEYELGWLAAGRLLEEFAILRLAAAVDLVDRNELIEVWRDISHSELAPFLAAEEGQSSDASMHVSSFFEYMSHSEAASTPMRVAEEDAQSLEELMFLRPSSSVPYGSLADDPAFEYEAKVLFASDRNWERYLNPRDKREQDGWAVVDGHLAHIDAIADWSIFCFEVDLVEVLSSAEQPVSEGFSRFNDFDVHANPLVAAAAACVNVPWMSSRDPETDAKSGLAFSTASNLVRLPLDERAALAVVQPFVDRLRLRYWAGILVEGWRRIDQRQARRSLRSAQAVEAWTDRRAGMLPPGSVAALREGLRDRWS